jgi:hypothetical protein
MSPSGLPIFDSNQPDEDIGLHLQRELEQNIAVTPEKPIPATRKIARLIHG